MKIMTFERIFLKLLMFWLPIPVTLAMAWVWRRHTGNIMIVSYAVLVPLLYGYCMPFIATNVLKRWRFKNGFMIGGMYAHHGFMYASKMSLFGFIPLLLLKRQDLDVAASCAWVACTALPYAFTAWLQDSLSMKYGYVEFGHAENNTRGEGAAVIASYAPTSFTLIGCIFAAGLVTVYKICMAQQCSSLKFLTILFVIFALLATLPAITYMRAVKS